MSRLTGGIALLLLTGLACSSSPGHLTTGTDGGHDVVTRRSDAGGSDATPDGGMRGRRRDPGRWPAVQLLCRVQEQASASRGFAATAPALGPVRPAHRQRRSACARRSRPASSHMTPASAERIRDQLRPGRNLRRPGGLPTLSGGRGLHGGNLRWRRDRRRASLRRRGRLPGRRDHRAARPTFAARRPINAWRPVPPTPTASPASTVSAEVAGPRGTAVRAAATPSATRAIAPTASAATPPAAAPVSPAIKSERWGPVRRRPPARDIRSVSSRIRRPAEPRACATAREAAPAIPPTPRAPPRLASMAPLATRSGPATVSEPVSPPSPSRAETSPAPAAPAPSPAPPQTDCAPGHSCTIPTGSTVGTCGQKVDGQSCTADTDCVNANCADGVCCATTCSGACRSCAVAGALGTCTYIAAGGADPHGVCKDLTAAMCSTDGKCDGAGACRKYAVGTVCAPETCSGSSYTQPSTCSAAGACTSPAATSCSPYQCNGSACYAACTDDTRVPFAVHLRNGRRRQLLRQEAAGPALLERQSVRERAVRAGRLLQQRLQHRLSRLRHRGQPGHLRGHHGQLGSRRRCAPRRRNRPAARRGSASPGSVREVALRDPVRGGLLLERHPADVAHPGREVRRRR